MIFEKWSGRGNESKPKEKDIKTMLDIANCRAQGARLMTEKLDEFLLRKENSAETENQIELDFFRDALQEQIDIMFDIYKRLQDICQRLGVE